MRERWSDFLVSFIRFGPKLTESVWLQMAVVLWFPLVLILGLAGIREHRGVPGPENPPPARSVPALGSASAAGDSSAASAAGEDPSSLERGLDDLYRCLRLFTLDGPAGAGNRDLPFLLQVARFLAAIGVLGGILIGVTALLWRRLTGWLVRLGFFGHSVVCGVGGKGSHLVRDLLSRNASLVVIEQDEDNVNLDWIRKQGVPVIVGDARSPRVLRGAGVLSASSLFCMTRDDGTNTEIVLAAKESLDSPGVAWKRGRYPRNSLEAHVVVVHDGVARQLDRHNRQREGARDVTLRVFNLDEVAAKRLFRDQPTDVHARILDAERPNLVVLGFGRMGERVVVNAVTAPFLAGIGTEPVNPAITVIDSRFDELGPSFAVRYRNLDRVCEFRGIQREIRNGTFQDEELKKQLLAPGTITGYYVCFGDDETALETAASLREAIWPSRELRAPIFVQMYEDAGLARLTGEVGSGHVLPAGMYPFGMLRSLCTEEVVQDRRREDLARRFHADYRKEAGKNDRPLAETEWKHLAETFKQSNRRQAEHVEAKLRLAGLAAVRCDSPGEGPARNPLRPDSDTKEALARLEHERWNAEKYLEGWRYGKVRKDTERIHDCLTGWESLEASIQDYDRSHVERIPAVLADRDECVRPIRRMGFLPEDRKLGEGERSRAARELLRHVRDRISAGDHVVLVSTLSFSWERDLARAALDYVEEQPPELEVPVPFPYEYYEELLQKEREQWEDLPGILARASRHYEIPRESGYYPAKKLSGDGEKESREYEEGLLLAARTLLEASCQEILVPGEDGGMTVLPGRAALPPGKPGASPNGAQ